MSRALWQIIVAGWISAALTVSPVVAAMQCRVCCDGGAAAAEEAETPSTKPCCAEHAKSAPAEPREPCPTCPKCDAQRPSPAIAGASGDWKPPVETLAAVESWPVDARLEFVLLSETGRSCVDRAMPPPPRVLYCTWQK